MRLTPPVTPSLWGFLLAVRGLAGLDWRRRSKRGLVQVLHQRHLRPRLFHLPVQIARPSRPQNLLSLFQERASP
jgi:hypothetical protein